MKHVVRALLLAVLAPPAMARAQRTTDSGPQRPTVFLDCQTNCDEDLIRTEITWVDWVRDRTVADVHLLLTSQTAGVGGREVTLAFLGQGRFARRSDTLTVVSTTTDTDDERRRAVTRTIAAGLVSFAARTPAIAQLRITAARATTPGASPLRVRDPWNAWVFEIELGGAMDGERLDRSRELNGGISANRVTPLWKVETDFNFSYDENKTTVIDFDDNGEATGEETFLTLQRNGGVEALVVRSLNGRWSAGMRGEMGSNSFQNQRLSTELTPAIEYNIFPYDEATRRQLTIQYGVGMRSFRYTDTTIFEKMGETLPFHYVDANYRTRQPWGATNVSLEHRNYLYDPSKRNTEIQGDLSVRLFRGLNVNVGASYSWVRDQLYIRKGRRDLVDVLLRRQQLLTTFQYEAQLSLSYTFGSIFNSVVNPRF